MSFRRPEQDLEVVDNALDLQIAEVIRQRVIISFLKEAECSM
jgi:hypothetical protein